MSTVESVRARSRPLPAPPAEEQLALWPVADARLRSVGFLADLDETALAAGDATLSWLGRFAGRWRSLTGARPELHLRFGDQGSDDDLLATARCDGRWAQVVAWWGSVGAASGSTDRPDRPDDLYGARIVDLRALRTSTPRDLLGPVLVTGVDDEAALRAVQRWRPWRALGTAIGEPDTAEGWCWWAAGLGLGEAGGLRRSARWARR